MTLSNGQDPPDPETTKPAEPTEPTTTTAKVETTTVSVKNVTCYDCLGEMENGSVTKGDENCFTLNDLDAVGVKDVGPVGFCEVEAWFSEENGIIKKGIRRGGDIDSGDVSLYPQEQYSSSEEVVCNTGTLCNDKDANGFFPASFTHRSKRSVEVFIEEKSFLEILEDDDKTTTKAPTTTAPTTTVVPDFQCYMCMANSNGNITELGGCMNPADNDATLDVCGDGIGSCRFLFKINGDSTEDTDEFTIERTCNDADQPNDEKLKIDQTKKIKCLDSKCNSDKYDLGSSLTITISVFAFLISLLI